MSSLPNPMMPAQDDARLELSMAAMRSERRNRPRFVLVLASLVLLGALAHLLWTFTGRTSAANSLSRATSSMVAIQGAIAQLEALEARRSSPKYNQDSSIEARLQVFAEQIGLPRPEVSARAASGTVVRNFVNRTYHTIITEADPELLLRWVAESTDGKNFPGLELDQIKLTPGRTLESGKVAWTLDVAFRRWERTP